MFPSIWLIPSLLGLAAALPSVPSDGTASAATKRSFSCANLAYGLNAGDCNYMSQIGIAGQGSNPQSPNGVMWIGNQGPNTFTFTNNANNPSPVSVTLIIWHATDYSSSFVNARAPYISYSLPNIGDSVTISLANGVSGAFAALNNHTTTLSQYGQVYNTWGEFTTGNYATVDISREVNMGGNKMSIKTSGGCHADMNTCAFTCKSGNTCGTSGSYNLLNCAPGSQPGASGGEYGGNPSGGCQGWSNGGHLDISLERY